jgi:hypothetical protein
VAQETIITNVGEDDKSSVASEATLIELVSAVEKMAKAAGYDPAATRAKVEKALVESTKVNIKESTKYSDSLKEKTKATDKATESINLMSKSFGLVTAIFGGVVGAGTNLVRTLVDGGDTLTDFAQHIPIVGNQLSILTGLIDQNISNFRQFSQIGAVFGNGLNDIRLIAAQAAIPLNDFVQLIQQNADSMKLFGASTAEGAREFARLSKELRDGVGRDLLNLGFTSAELNELLIDYAELQARQFTRDRVQGRVTAENAAAFGEELLRISVITGRRREQIQDELRQQQNDIRIRAARSRLEQTEGEKFTLNLAMISGASSELANALVDINDDIPSGEVTRRLMQFSDTFARAGADIANMDTEEFNNFVVSVRRDLEEFARSQGKTLEELSAVPGFEGMFGIIGELQGFREITAKNREEILAAMEAEKNRENALKNFQEDLNNLRGQLMETFIDSGILPRITEMFETFIGFLGRSSVIDSFMTAVESVVDFLLGPSVLLHPGGTEERAGGFIDRMIADIEEKGIGQYLLDLMGTLGSTLMEGATTAITEGIKNLWEHTNIIETMAASILALWAGPKVISAMVTGIASMLSSAGASSAAGSAASTAAGSAASGGTMSRILRGLRTAATRAALPLAVASLGYELAQLYKRGPASESEMQELREGGDFETFQEDWMNQDMFNPQTTQVVEPPRTNINQNRIDLENERAEILQEAAALGIASQEQQDRLLEIHNQLVVQTEATNSLLQLITTLNTTMTEVRDTERSMLDLERFLASIAEEGLQIQRDIERNTEAGSDISRSGITNFGR